MSKMVAFQLQLMLMIWIYCVDSVSLKKYHYLDQYKTWTDAQIYCQAEFGTDLASIHDENDMDEIRRVCIYSCWIGLHDKKDENTFVWQDGTTYDFGTEFSVYPWQYGRPNNLNNEDCIIYQITDDWNDIDCNSHRDFAVCNIPSILCIHKENDIDWNILSGDWQWISNCNIFSDSNDIDSIAMINDKQWFNIDNELVIQYMFTIQNMHSNDGNAGVLLWSFNNSICHYYYIGIIPSNHTIFLYKMYNGSINTLAQNSTFIYVLGNYYPFKVIVNNNGVFSISIHDIEYIQYMDSDYISNAYSGYIGIKNTNLSIIAKSLYISVTEINVTSTANYDLNICTSLSSVNISANITENISPNISENISTKEAVNLYDISTSNFADVVTTITSQHILEEEVDEEEGVDVDIDDEEDTDNINNYLRSNDSGNIIFIWIALAVLIYCVLSFTIIIIYKLRNRKLLYSTYDVNNSEQCKKSVIGSSMSIIPNAGKKIQIMHQLQVPNNELESTGDDSKGSNDSERPFDDYNVYNLRSDEFIVDNDSISKENDDDIINKQNTMTIHGEDEQNEGYNDIHDIDINYDGLDIPGMMAEGSSMHLTSQQYMD